MMTESFSVLQRLNFSLNFIFQLDVLLCLWKTTGHVLTRTKVLYFQIKKLPFLICLTKKNYTAYYRVAENN